LITGGGIVEALCVAKERLKTKSRLRGADLGVVYERIIT